MFNENDVLGKHNGYTVVKCLGKEKNTYKYEVLFDNGDKVIRTRQSILKGLSLPKPKVVKKRIFKESKDIEHINKAFNLDCCLVLDQSSKDSGYSIVINGNIVDWGLIKNIGDNSYRRNYNLVKKIKTLVDTYNIKSIVLENIFLGTNVHTYNVLSSTIATIAYFCIDQDINLSLLSNPCWTSLVGITGKRESRKEQSLKIVKDLGITIKDDNIADAICMSLALIKRSRL